MTDLPTHITHAQLGDACRALGINPNITVGVNITIRVGLEQVVVLQYATDDEGRKFVVGNAEAMNTTRIPVQDTAPTQPSAAERKLRYGEETARRIEESCRHIDGGICRTCKDAAELARDIAARPAPDRTAPEE